MKFIKLVKSLSILVASASLSMLMPTMRAWSLVSSLPTRMLRDPDRGIEVKVVDLSKVNFGSLPRIRTSGELDGIGREWFAGQTPAEFLQLSDISDGLGAEQFTLNEIEAIASLNLSNVALSSFPLAGQQKLEQLVDAVPYLGDYQVADVEVLASLFELSQSEWDIPDVSRARLLGVLGDRSLSEISVSELLNRVPGLGDVVLEEVADLSRFAIDSIPNLDATQLSKLSGWRQEAIASIPGLSQVPLTDFPKSLEGLGDLNSRTVGNVSNIVGLANVVSRIDFVYGAAESRRDRTISGSDVEGFAVPCYRDCAYLELDDIENFGSGIRGITEGQQWISGKYQEVSGGKGCLKFVNGGKEPTGRLPFGSSFKVVVMSPDETTDTVNFAIYFRFCSKCGCTPYFIGPVPFGSNRVNDLIFIGL
jgi:hypothetical protein